MKSEYILVYILGRGFNDLKNIHTRTYLFAPSVNILSTNGQQIEYFKEKNVVFHGTSFSVYLLL